MFALQKTHCYFNNKQFCPDYVRSVRRQLSHVQWSF